MSDHQELPYAYGPPPASGRLRTLPEDFQVEEVLGFGPDGAGEHLLIQIRKRNTNTEWLAKQLARFCQVPPNDVSYAGLKDRNAVTTQWFSVRLAGRPEPDWSGWTEEGTELLQVGRHSRKLKRGALRGNRFTLRIRELQGEDEALEARLRAIASGGVPNYFGEQRFGRDGDNVEMARRLFAGELKGLDRHRRGLYLSAARSHLFNLLLARRVERGDWNRALPGDAMMLDGRSATFRTGEPDEILHRRMSEQDIHPTGPLWGKGDRMAEGEAGALEQEIVAAHPDLAAGLIRCGLEQERRALRLRVAELQWRRPAPGQLEMAFQLPAGGYATTVLREVIRVASSAGEPPFET